MRSLATIFDNVEENNVQLNSTAVELAQLIRKAHDEALSLLTNLSTYANCLLSVDSQHDGAQKISGTLQAYEKRMGDVFEPLSQFEDQASDTVIDEYLNDPAVAPARFTVEHSRKRRHENLTLDEAIVCSAARCARSSYANHDNSMTTYENDSKLADRLIGSDPMHLSPFEHQARPFNDEKEKERFSSNFRHFFQQRKAIEFEAWKYEKKSIHEEE